MRGKLIIKSIVKKFVFFAIALLIGYGIYVVLVGEITKATTDVQQTVKPVNYEREAYEKRRKEILNDPNFQQMIQEEVDKIINEEQYSEAKENLDKLKNAGFFRLEWYVETSTIDGKDQIDSPYRELIYSIADEYGVDGTLMSKIIFCESSFNTFAQSKTSSAKGLFQIIDSTWANTPQGKAGRSRFEPEANISAGAWLMSEYGSQPWDSSSHCWQA